MCTNFPGIRMNRERGVGILSDSLKILSVQDFIVGIEFLVITLSMIKTQFFNTPLCVYHGYRAASTLGYAARVTGGRRCIYCRGGKSEHLMNQSAC